MIALQYAALVLVAVSGAAVALSYDPRRQAVVTGLFGVGLAILFFAFQAPDVALSQIAIGSVALPAMILLALAKIERLDQRDEEQGDGE
jgi:energy-converting hydrogenase B subunit D